MKSLVCLLVTLGIAYGAILPARPNCMNTFCTMVFLVCPDGRPAPVPADSCCPSLSACKPAIVNPVKPVLDCSFALCTMILLTCPDGTPAPVPADSCCPSLSACKPAIVNPVKPTVDCTSIFCTMDLKICPDGSFAPIPEGECCPSLAACRTLAVGKRSNPLGSLGSLLSGSNLLQTLSTATHGTDLGTAISILNLLNNLHQISNDIHQIPLLINQTLAAILNGTGQAGQVVIDQLTGALTTATHQGGASRDLLGVLGQNANLLSSITHLLPQGTSISSILSILKLLSNINQLTNDVHQIPAILNQTLASILNVTGQAGQVVVQQLLNLVGVHPQAGSRDLLGVLGQNANLLSSITHLLPQGTSISSILSILNLLSNINQLNNDIHQIPALLNHTLTTILNGTGQAGEIVIQQLLNLVGIHSQTGSRDLLGALGQNANLISTISHLLPEGTSISTIVSLLSLLNNVNALNNDLHQIPAVLQETLQNIINGVHNILPPLIQPLPGLLDGSL